MADKTIRFITDWNGYKPGDTLTDDEAVTDELVAGGLATEDLVGPSGSYATSLVEHAAAHGAMASWGALTSQVNALAVLHLYGSGAPVDYTDGTPPATGEGTAPPGAIYSDISPAGSGFVYRNSGSQAEPIWTKLADAA
jgi:hypothetical protein